MPHDENFTRFFCFLSLFAGAMLGVVIANSLLLLFMCWEIVGLTSYLLIGFWYERPARCGRGQEGVHHHAHRRPWSFCSAWCGFIGQTGTLLFYDHGAGCLEHTALTLLATQTLALAWRLRPALRC